MQQWIRFSHAGTVGFGALDGQDVRVFTGDMYADPVPAEIVLRLDDIKLLAPAQPTKIIAMYNNFGALVEKMSLTIPAEPLFLIKAPNSYLNPGETIRKPPCDSRVIFEGELGVVIGKTCTAVSESKAMSHVFGFTCANDVTAVDILTRDPSFPQWARAKGFDTFCPFGPTIATGLNPKALTVKTVLNGSVRQDYPISDMLFSVDRLVSMLSKDMTLFPGDIILCGTSVGVGVMKPGSTVEVEIGGIGKLVNRFE